MFKKQGRTL